MDSQDTPIDPLAPQERACLSAKDLADLRRAGMPIPGLPIKACPSASQAPQPAPMGILEAPPQAPGPAAPEGALFGLESPAPFDLAPSRRPHGD